MSSAKPAQLGLSSESSQTPILSHVPWKEADRSIAREGVAAENMISREIPLLLFLRLWSGKNN